MPKPVIQVIPDLKELLDATRQLKENLRPQKAEVKPVPYRKLALQHYGHESEGGRHHLCVVCGFGVAAVLEVAHLDQNRKNNAISNLALLCPNCHKMHDIGLLPTDVVCRLRDEHRSENWGLRVKDAGKKAALTKKAAALAAKRSAAAKRASVTRAAKKKK